jgi:threonine dehydrogenase-like Zn-dependent dehydrogenase
MAADDSSMRGLWVDNGRARLRADLPRPVASPGWALVEVLVSGVCGTDLQIMRGYAGFAGVLGHEFVGRVVGGSTEWLGRRVVGEINVGCGACEQCALGLAGSRHCVARRVLGIRGLNGTFAEYLLLPEANLHEVPANVPTGDAAFVEPLAAALHVADQLAIQPADRVLVVGDGRLGQLVARAMHSAGADVTVTGRHRSKLERLERLGISTREPAAGAFSTAIECTGNAAGFEAAQRSLRPQGTLVLKSTYPDGVRIDAAALVVDEIQVRGSRCGPFEPALEALASGAIHVADLVDGTFALDAAVEALRAAARPGVIKVQITSKSLPNP